MGISEYCPVSYLFFRASVCNAGALKENTHNILQKSHTTIRITFHSMGAHNKVYLVSVEHGNVINVMHNYTLLGCICFMENDM